MCIRDRFKAGRLLTFSAFRMGTYSRWALIQGWVLIHFLGSGVGVVAYLSLSRSGREVGWGGRLFEAGRLLTFSAFRMGAYSRWALI